VPSGYSIVNQTSPSRPEVPIHHIAAAIATQSGTMTTALAGSYASPIVAVSARSAPLKFGLSQSLQSDPSLKGSNRVATDWAIEVVVLGIPCSNINRGNFTSGFFGASGIDSFKPWRRGRKHVAAVFRERRRVGFLGKRLRRQQVFMSVHPEASKISTRMSNVAAIGDLFPVRL